MTVRAYILIECEAARSGAVSGGLRHLAVAHAKVLSSDTMSGPFDVIVLLESPDLDGLGRAVAEGVQKISGVRRTVTCVVMEPV
jgi:DNA-binding Lrp family transcriptional regulator